MINKHYKKLFERGKIGSLELENRIVRASTGTYLSNPDGSVTDRLIKAYEESAKGGVGLVFIDNAATLKEYHMGVCAASDEYIPGLSLLAAAVAENGAKSGMQLAHPGRDGVFVGAAGAKAASRMQWEDWYQWGFAVPQELTIEEIHEIVNAFGDAALRVKIAGFDIVEVLAGSGNLATNFLSPGQNKRNDMYGGSLNNRMRFLIESIRDVRKKIGPDYPLSVRLTLDDFEPDGVRLEESIEVGKALEKEGVDVFHVICGSHAEAARVAGCTIMPLALHLPAFAAFKKEMKTPVMGCGSITYPELAEEILESGKLDFIAMGRPLIADPDWPVKAKEGRAEDIKPCIRCNDGCHDKGMLSHKPGVCTVNPTLFKSEKLAVTKAEQKKKVAVIGAGPAGMEAARICTLRGHDVTIYEKRELGGVLIEASAPDFKADIRRLIEYYKNQAEKLGISVVKKEATSKEIISEKYDTAIVAIGAQLRKLDVKGIDNPIVINALDVLNGKAKVGKKVVVIGGGVTGVEVGLFLAEQGKEISFVEMLDMFMSGIGHNRNAYNERLAAQKISIHTGNLLYEVLDNAAVIMDRFGRKTELDADTIVLASGFAPQTELKEQLEKDPDIEVFAVGDCVGARMIFEAIHEGFLKARRV